MYVLTEQFKLELLRRRAAGIPSYRIARAAGVRPTELSGLVGGSVQARPNDPRIAAVAAVLGLSLDESLESGGGDMR